jgi:hypothetical protein
VKLGKPNGAAALRRPGKGSEALRAAIGRNADRHAQDLAGVIVDIQAAGGITLWAIAAKLNACCMLTHRGRSWHVSTVQNLLRRLEKRRLAALAITTSLLSGCATVGSDGPGPMTCPPAIEYSREDWAHAAEELNSLPDGSAVAVKQSHSSQDNLDHVESVGHRDASPNMHARPRRCYDSIH